MPFSMSEVNFYVTEETPQHKTIFVCKRCLDSDDVMVEVETRFSSDAPGHEEGQWVCPRCESVCGVFLNQGTLDLGLIREQQ